MLESMHADGAISTHRLCSCLVGPSPEPGDHLYNARHVLARYQGILARHMQRGLACWALAVVLFWHGHDLATIRLHSSLHSCCHGCVLPCILAAMAAFANEMAASPSKMQHQGQAHQ